MSNLLESIISEDYVSATKIFESRIEEIVEQKLLEAKKQVQAEAMGGRTIAQAIKDMQARGLTPRKASDALGDPRDEPLPAIGTKQKSPVKRKKIKEESLDEIRAAGEVPGSEGRKQDAATLRQMRKGLGMLGLSKEKSSIQKDYLAKRKAQMEPVRDAGAISKPSKKSKEGEPSETRAKSFKYLSGDEVGLRTKPRLSAADQYEKGLKQAKDFEARGREGAVNKFRGSKAAVKYRAGREAKGFASAMGGFAKNIISGLGGLYEEENN